MPDDSKTDAVDKLLSEQKAIEDRRQALIAELLKQKEAAIRDFDDKLAKLGHQANSKPKRSHHKKMGGPASAGKPTAKPKAST